MIESIKKNYLIIIAFLIPVSFITIFSVLTLLPGALIKTDYNFVYYTCFDEFNYSLDSNFCKLNFEKQYQIINKKLVKKSNNTEINFVSNETKNENPIVGFKFYIFDSKSLNSNRIGDAELQIYSIDTARVSPDGVEFIVKNPNEAGINFPIGSGYNTNQYYLSNNLGTVRLNIIPEDFDDSYSFTNSISFIGWIEK